MRSPASSFYAQILRLLLPFIIGVVLLYSALIQVAINKTEDHLIHRFLEAELEHILKHTGKQSTAQPLNSNSAMPTSTELNNRAFLTTYWASDPALPSNYAQLGIGIHELGDEQNHLLIAEIPQAKQRVYILFNEDKLSHIESYETLLDSGLIMLAFTLLLVAGGVISALIAKKLASPLEQLVRELQQGWQADSPLHGSSRQDEIGELSRNLESYAKKLQDVLDREKSFTRHASHEMRTPIGVIKNSLSVIKLPNITVEKRNKNLQRIHNACDDLEQLTNVFLMLGRPNQSITLSPVSIAGSLESVLHRLKHLLDEQQADVNIQGDKSLTVSTNSALFQVLLINLLVNAVQHGEGTIQIVYDDRSIVIENTIASAHVSQRQIQSQSQSQAQLSSHGYGLEIVARICRALAWTYESESQTESFVARVNFNHS